MSFSESRLEWGDGMKCNPGRLFRCPRLDPTRPERRFATINWCTSKGSDKARPPNGIQGMSGVGRVALLLLDVGGPDQFDPLLGFIGDELFEVGPGKRQRTSRPRSAIRDVHRSLSGHIA